MTLSGTDTLAHYQQVLRSVTFTSSSSDPTQGGANATRTVFWTLNDGSASSAGSTTTVQIGASPTLSVVAQTNATRGQQIALSSLVTILDPGNVGYQALEFWDNNGSTAATGQLFINGVAQTGGHEIDVTPANVANVVFDVGTAGGSDTVSVRLKQNNGQEGDWHQQFTVTAPADRAPVVNATNVTATRGQTSAAAAGDLFSVSDPDGDTIIQYQVWDTQGHWSVPGQTPVAGHWIDITAAQLAQTTYVFGGAADELFIKAFVAPCGVTRRSSWQARLSTMRRSRPRPRSASARLTTRALRPRACLARRMRMATPSPNTRCGTPAAAATGW